MANNKHLEIIKQGIEIWNKWMNANPDIRPDLSGADLSRADLSRADLGGADLGGADLRRASLREVDLERASLGGANLFGADLAFANLVGADLGEANLFGANLFGANLFGANLFGANLGGVNLGGANLGGADLEGANLGEATIGWTTFTDNDLSSIKGLDTVEHEGPSSIGIDTLFKSQGTIPLNFLRSAGVPEDFITYIPSLVGRAIDFYSCFISYSHADKAFARRLHDTLQGRGIRCWLDEHQLLPGHDIYEEVDHGIRLWDKVLLCCSKDSLTSWWVDNEINTAFDKEQQMMKQRGKKVLALIPLNLDGYLFSGKWESGKATQVKSRLAADFTGWKRSARKFDEQFERLVKALRADSGGKEPPPQQKL